jgi:hypothetical protein
MASPQLMSSRPRPALMAIDRASYGRPSMPGQRKNPGLLGEEEDRGLKRRMDEGYRPARPYAGRKAASAC